METNAQAAHDSFFSECHLDVTSLVSSRKSEYPRAPQLIESSWVLLAKAIFELGARYDKLPRNYGEYLWRNAADPDDSTFIEPDFAKFLQNCMVLLGKIPVEANIEFSDGRPGKRDVSSFNLPKRNTGIAQEEAALCLEMLVARVWHDLYVIKVDNKKEMMQSIIESLEYFYWEAPLNESVSLIWDELPLLADSVYEEVRALTHRDLFLLNESGSLSFFVKNFKQSIGNIDAIGSNPHARPPRQEREFNRPIETQGPLTVGVIAATRGVRGRPGPIPLLALHNKIKLSDLLDHIQSSYPKSM